MRRLHIALLLAPLAANLTTVLTAAPASAQTLLIDRVVVRINDRIATMMDFQRQLAERRGAILANQALSETTRQQELASVGRDVLTDIYQEMLLLSRADQLGARITESDIDKAVAQTRERMGLQSDEQMQQALAVSGLTEETLRERMRDNLLVQEVMGREVHPRLRVDEDEMRRFYREHAADFTNPAAIRLEEVVVLEQGRDAAAVAAAARQVHDQLATAGAEEVVRKAAAGELQVVDLGWVVAGDLDPELESAAWQLQPGGVTAPVAGRGGLHVVKQLERRAAALRPFDEVKEQISARVEQARLAKEYPAYLRELEQRSYVALKVPPEAEGFKGLGDEEGRAPDALEGLRDLAPARAPAAPAAKPPQPDSAPPPPPGTA